MVNRDQAFTIQQQLATSTFWGGNYKFGFLKVVIQITVFNLEIL